MLHYARLPLVNEAEEDEEEEEEEDEDSIDVFEDGSFDLEYEVKDFLILLQRFLLMSA